MARRGGVARLAALSRTMERMRSLELRVAAGAVDEVECAAAMAAVVRKGQLAEGREGLSAGDRQQWQVAETTRATTEARMERLAKVRVEREVRRDEAAMAYRASRLSLEQMERVVERTQRQQAVEEGRRMQAESDDRFGSRRAWMQQQGSE